MATNRTLALAGLLAGTLVIAYLVLSAILGVIIFAITVAYVLYPVREWIRERGVSRRVASALTTTGVFFLVMVVLAPVGLAIYERREQFVETLEAIPETIAVDQFGIETEIEVGPILESVVDTLQAFTLELAVSIPELLLSLAVFTFVLYGILYKPGAVHAAVIGMVPPAYHDIVYRLHYRTRDTLYSIYVIQFATAAATFIIAAIIFTVLGYGSPLWLAFFAALLQFVPIIGPSVLVLGLVASDLLLFGEPARAVAVAVLGLVFISMIPDVTIRPRLAAHTGGFSSTLYFVGFVGGLLTVGAIGFILGPLAVALLVEVIKLLSERADATGEQRTLEGLNSAD